MARGLKLRRTGALGMMVPDITNPLFPAIFKGVEAVARQAGYSVILYHMDEAQRDYNAHLDVLNERRVDGLILAAAFDGHGNWAFNTAYAAAHGLRACVSAMAGLEETLPYLTAGVPIIGLPHSPGRLETAPRVNGRRFGWD